MFPTENKPHKIKVIESHNEQKSTTKRKWKIGNNLSSMSIHNTEKEAFIDWYHQSNGLDWHLQNTHPTKAENTFFWSLYGTFTKAAMGRCGETSQRNIIQWSEEMSYQATKRHGKTLNT